MSANAKRHGIVVGAGVIGASIAYHLAEAGCRVTLIDRDEPGGVASPCSFGWTNASHRNPRPYYELRLRAMQLWDDLAARYGDIPYRRTGAFYLDEKWVDLDAFCAQHSDWGYQLTWIDADDIRRLEPLLTVVPERGLLAPGEGAVEADGAAQFFAALCAQRDGCAVVRAAVSDLIVESGRVAGVVTDQGRFEADEVVLAAGAETDRLAGCAGVHVPLVTSPGLLIQTKPWQHRITHLILAEAVHFRQRADGAFVAGADFGGGEINDDPEGGSQELIQAIRGELQGGEDIALSGYTVGHRPTPADGFPIVGRAAGVAGLYIAVMHSGATLAPAVGQMATHEIVDGQRDPLLGPYGVDRF